MPILQWLFKSSSSRREQCTEEDDSIIVNDTQKSRELVIFNKDSNCGESETEATFATFFSTLQLKHLNSLNFRLMGQRTEPVAVGCKVLPICDVASLGSRSSADIGGEGMEKSVQKRRKAFSRMKELVRWAAAARTRKAGIKGWKVLYFRNKMALKDSLDDASSSSSKLSFRWDVGSCSASSVVLSPLSLPSASTSDQMCSKNLCTPPVALQSSSSNVSELDCLKTENCRKGGQWITSDSDFVVLEL